MAMSRLIPTCRNVSHLFLTEIRRLDHTYHPVLAFSLQLRGLHICEERLCLIPLFILYMLSDLHHLLDSVRLQQIVIVEMIEQNVDPLGHVINLRLECGWCHGPDASHLRRQEVNDRLCSGRYVRAIASGI